MRSYSFALIGILVTLGTPALARPRTTAEDPDPRAIVLAACTPLERAEAVRKGQDEQSAARMSDLLCSMVAELCTTRFDSNREPCTRDLRRFEEAYRETGSSMIHTASYHGHAALVKILIVAGLDVNFHAQGDSATPLGGSWTALMLAAAEGHAETVSVLTTAGADANAKNLLGRTALMFAARYGYEEIVKDLLEHGADPNIASSDEDGWTALIGAAHDGHLGAVDLLLDHGADPSVKDKHGKTASAWAAERGYSRVVRRLEKAGQE